MTQYTYYTLTLTGKERDILGALAEIIGAHEKDPDAFRCLYNECVSTLADILRKREKTEIVLLGENEDTWFCHESDMRNLSSSCPEVLFELLCESRDTSNVWKEYYKDGKMQICYAKMVFPPYDESKLE